MHPLGSCKSYQQPAAIPKHRQNTVDLNQLGMKLTFLLLFLVALVIISECRRKPKPPKGKKPKPKPSRPGKPKPPSSKPKPPGGKPKPPAINYAK